MIDAKSDLMSPRRLHTRPFSLLSRLDNLPKLQICHACPSQFSVNHTDAASGLTSGSIRPGSRRNLSGPTYLWHWLGLAAAKNPLMGCCYLDHDFPFISDTFSYSDFNHGDCCRLHCHRLSCPFARSRHYSLLQDFIGQ